MCRPIPLQGSITAGTNDRYVMDLGNLTGVDPTALEPMGFQLASGRWPDTGPASKKATKIQVLVGDYTGYNFYDSRKSESSPNRYRWQGMTDAQGNQVEPFVNVDKDKMTLTIKTGEGSTEKTQTWELEVVGHIQQGRQQGLVDPEQHHPAHPGPENDRGSLLQDGQDHQQQYLL